VYTTATGLYIAVCSNVTDLSEKLYGTPSLDLQANADYQLRVNHIQLVQLVTSLSTVDAKLYTTDAKIG